LARAEEGLLHVMGVLRERVEVRTGFERSARRLQHPLHLSRLNGAAARGAIERCAIERFDHQSRPKIGMLPSVRIDGLANA
jgi:hypothetical protein